MTDLLISGVEAALYDVAQAKDAKPTLRQFAEAAVRAVLAPLPPAPTAAELDAHLGELERGLAVIHCGCGRSPSIAFSHERSCSGELRARKQKDPTAGAPVKVG